MIEKKCENCRRFYNCSNEPERLELCFSPDEEVIRLDERKKMIRRFKEELDTPDYECYISGVEIKGLYEVNILRCLESEE